MVDENDVSYVTFEQIIQILPNAAMKQNGSCLFHEFNQQIDVFERR